MLNKLSFNFPFYLLNCCLFNSLKVTCNNNNNSAVISLREVEDGGGVTSSSSENLNKIVIPSSIASKKVMSGYVNNCSFNVFIKTYRTGECGNRN